MGATATFNYGTWVTRYPEFTSVAPDLIASYAVEATLYHSNNGSGPVQDAGQQLLLLNMVVAHIAQLNAPPPAQKVAQTGSPQLVGRITNASEGSVSVSATLDLPPGSSQWWAQTRYGLAYWQATAPYRTMRYRPNPGRNMNPFFGRGGY